MIFTSLLCSNDSRVTHIQLSNCRINDTGIVTTNRDESSGVKKEKCEYYAGAGEPGRGVNPTRSLSQAGERPRMVLPPTLLGSIRTPRSVVKNDRRSTALREALIQGHAPYQ